MEILGKAIENIVSAVVYTLNFKEKNEALKRKLLQLESMKSDVMIELENAELRTCKKPKNEVQNWLSNVGRVENEVANIEQGVAQGEWSILLKKLVEKKIEDVKELIDQRDKLQGELVLDPHEVIGDKLLAPELVGQAFHINKNEIWDSLLKDEVLSIGIYGMGGIGKTTLLTHVYNELLQTQNGFRYVYWVTVSQDFSIYKLQNLIAKSIGLELSSENDEKKRAAKLSNELVRKGKLVLILDDLWNHFLLEKVGVPIGVNGCKLILTTRSLDVCQIMGCQKNIKVEPLSEKESWNLFEDKLGKAVTVGVKPIAESIVKECAGLPLGIITIAGSMRGVDDVREWRNALRELQESEEVKQGDMEYEVFRVLKFSYNRLPDSSLQQCFLYCALYPEDYNIRRENLIEYLIVEGVIEEMKSRQAKFDKGHSMLNRLEKVCLLEGGSEYGYAYVKMHDLIRDMAIQIMKVDPRVIVKSGLQLFEMPDYGNWTEDLVRISLMYNNIDEIPSGHSPGCPNLSTILLRDNVLLRSIGDSFFKKLQGLKVLDLSNTGIQELPSSISHLVNLSALLLHGCKKLRRVPSLMQLKALKKLDLSYSEVEEVPPGLELLSNLSYLDLRGTRMKELPPGILPRLSHLQFLMLDRSFIVEGYEVASLSKLERLICRFSDVCVFNRYISSTPLRNLIDYNLLVRQSKPPKYEPSQDWKGVCFYGCTIGKEKNALLLPKDVQYLYFDSCNLERSSLCLKNATNLKFFGISKCYGIECLEFLFSSPSIFQIVEDISIDNLKDLLYLFSGGGPAATTLLQPNSSFACLKTFHLCKCPSMKKLFDPGLMSNLQNLEEISVYYCENMEELIATEQEIHNCNGKQFALPKLQSFELKGLPQLRSICSRTMICESLQTVRIDDCPKLKRMSLSLLVLDNDQPSLLPSLQKIEIYPEEWWESVEFDHPKAKNVLSTFCDFQKHEQGMVRSNA